MTPEKLARWGQVGTLYFNPWKLWHIDARVNSNFSKLSFLYPTTNIMLYPPNLLSVRPSVRLSVHPSISASFPDSNFSSFWPIFFKLCMNIDIREEWFGSANGLNSFINNRIMALDWCKKGVFPQYLQNNWMNFDKFCICIDIYKIHVVSNAHYFVEFLTELWPLVDVRILFMLNIFWINLWLSIKFCICIDIDKM